MSTSNNTIVGTQFIDFINNKLKDEPAEFNFSFVSNGMPGSYTIIKRSTKDPLRSFPIVSIMFMGSPEYASPADMIAEFCELFAKHEYEYYKEQQNNVSSQISIQTDSSKKE
jgi:hypothetical protein